MADHFYAVLPAKAGRAIMAPDGNIVVGTGTAGSTYIELRVPDVLFSDAAIRHRARLVLREAIEALEEYLSNHKLPLGG